jgi:hypothetical protein
MADNGCGQRRHGSLKHVGEIKAMNELKIACPSCGQHIEFPANGIGQTIPCPTCEKPLLLTPDIVIPSLEINVAPAATQKPIGQKRVRTALSKLTEETITAKTKAGGTPLHRAARSGQFEQIPSHLLSVELFMAKNNAGETPLHVAAKHGHLNQVPRQFLTKETMTMTRGVGFYFTGSGYKARTETVLHTAASNGHADQIPNEFLTPEFLLIEATGNRQTVLEHIVNCKRLDLLPDNFAESELWSAKDSKGQTPRAILGILLERAAQLEAFEVERAAFVERVRGEPATEKQKEKLRFFGCSWIEGITKGQASDAISECVRKFPEVDRAYYDRPATDEQLARLRTFGEDTTEDPDDPLTYGQAKDWISNCEIEENDKIIRSLQKG